MYKQLLTPTLLTSLRLPSRSIGIKKDRFGYPVRAQDPEIQEVSKWNDLKNAPAPMIRVRKDEAGLMAYKKHIERKGLAKKEFLRECTQVVPQVEFQPGMRRVGLIGRKLGETRSFFRNGDVDVSTMIEIQDNCVMSCRPTVQAEGGEKWVMRVGAFDHPRVEEVPLVKQKEFLAIGQNPKQVEREFEVSRDMILPTNYKLDISHFFVGQYVDIAGVSVNRGFQGVIRRWGYKGQGYCYGRTKTHRRPGSISTQGLARVLSGKKLPGIMGNRNIFSRDRQILFANYERKYILIHGSVTGVVGGYVFLQDAKRMDPIQGPLLHYPTFLHEPTSMGTEVYDSSIIDPSEDFETVYANRFDRVKR